MINEMTNDEIEGLLGLQDIEANLLKSRKNVFQKRTAGLSLPLEKGGHRNVFTRKIR